MANQYTDSQLLHIVPQSACKVRGAKDWPGEVASIPFGMINGGILSLRDALEGRYTGLIDRDDTTLFSDQAGTAISLRLEVRNLSLANLCY